MGFPIRKSTDQRVFAPPRSLSQRITSFIACACQGIHQLPLRHLIVLIANTHRAISKRSSLQPPSCEVSKARSQRDRRLNQILCGIQFDVIGTKRPASRDRFEGAVRQTHHMQGIERPLRQIMTLAGHEVRTNLLFTMSNRTGAEHEARRKLFLRMTSSHHLYSTPTRQSLRITPSPNRNAAAEATILRIAHWWSRTGSNRRHPACKAGALPAELRPLIVPDRIDRQVTTLRVALLMVGLGGLEPPTSRLSSARSNQLSYKP